MDYNNTYWFDDKGVVIKMDNKTKISENAYVKNAQSSPQMKYRVTVGEGNCVVTEFKNDYDNELESNELWRAYYINGMIEKTGLMISKDFKLFKKFSQDMMTEYEYDYDIKERKITGEKRQIYNGYYKNDPKNHYPRSSKKEEYKNESHQIKDIQRGGVPLSKSEEIRLTIKTKKDYESACNSRDTVNEICFRDRCLVSLRDLVLADFPQLKRIVIEENKFCGKNLTISNLPQLESVTTGIYSLSDATSVEFSSNHILIR